MLHDRLAKISNDLATIQLSDNETFIKREMKNLKIQALCLYEDMVELEKKLLGGES